MALCFNVGVITNVFRVHACPCYFTYFDVEVFSKEIGLVRPMLSTSIVDFLFFNLRDEDLGNRTIAFIGIVDDVNYAGRDARGVSFLSIGMCFRFTYEFWYPRSYNAILKLGSVLIFECVPSRSCFPSFA